MKASIALIVSILISYGGLAQNLLSNPGFNSSGSWSATGYFQYDTRFSTWHTQYGYAYLTDFSGLPQNNISGTLSQIFYAPSNTAGLTVSFWYRITTTEPSSALHDTCGIWLLDQTNSAITYLTILTNFHANSSYQLATIYLPNQATGRSYKLVFAAKNDAQYPTVFRIDDASVTLNPAYSTGCVSWVNNVHPSPIVDSAMNKLCLNGIIPSSQDTTGLSGTISRKEIARYIGKALFGSDTTTISFMSNFPDLYPGLQALSSSDRLYMKLMQYLEYSGGGYSSLGTDNVSPFPKEHFFPKYNGSVLKSDAVKAMLESWNLSASPYFYNPTNTSAMPSICDITRNYKNCDYLQRATVLGLFNGISTACGATGIYYGTDNQITYKEFYVILSRLLSLYHKPIDYADFFLPNQFYFNNLNNQVGLEQGVFQDYSGKGIQIPSGGPGLEFEFSYHSGLTEIPFLISDTLLENTVGKAKVQPLGGGWTHSYSAFIKSLDPSGNVPTRVLIYWPDGTINSYLVQQSRYETKGITDQLTIDSFNAVNQPAQIRIRRGRVVYTFRNIDKGLYCTLSLISIADASGNKVGLSYTNGYSPTPGFEPKLLTTVTDTFSGRSLYFTYNATSNYLKTVTDPAGRQLKFSVNPYYHDLDTSWDAKNQATSYLYEGGGSLRSHLLVTITRPKGNYISNGYMYRKLTASLGSGQQIYVDRIPHYQDPLAQQSSFVKTIQNNQTITSNYAFDVAGNSLNESSDLSNIQRVYDTATNRLLLERDLKLGMIRKFGYDANGFLNKTVMLDSNFADSVKYEYVNNSYGEVTLLKDRNDSYTETKFYRNNNGQPTTIVTNEGLGGEIHHRFWYNNDGTLSSYQDPVERQTNYSYNSYGNLNRVDKLPYPITGGFTILNEKYSYDNVSRLIKHQDFVGDSTTYSYDNNDNLLSQNEDPGGLGLLTLYGYDANDNATSISSPKGHTTTLKYNLNTDDLSEENDGTDKKQWRYNQDGTLDSFVTKNGIVFKSTYYNSSLFPGTNLTGLLYSDGQRIFTYDTGTKNLHRIIYNGKENINWGNRGRWNKPAMIGVQNYFASGVFDAVSFEYDEHQRPTLVAFQSFSSTSTRPFHLSYYYEPVMRWLTQVYEDNRGKSYVKYDYQKDSKPTLEIYGNGDSTFYHYDGFNRLDSMWAVNKFSNLLYSIGATLDANGRHTSENLKIIYQGVVDTSLPPITAGTASYTYQLRNRILSGDGRTYISDNAGNIDSASGPSIGLTWSIYGKLLGINRGTSQTSYEYDGLGIRRRKNAIYYVVDQQNTGNVLVEATQSGVGISTYIWGNGLVARVNPQNDSAYYYHYDFRGSVVCITNQNGQVVQFYKYDPYGKVYAQKGNLTWNNPYQYLGRYGVQTDDSDVLYCKARYYQPSTGRFISEDPKWNTNLFIYGEDDPINKLDANGNFAETALDLGFAAYDGYQFYKHPSLGNGLFLAWDIAAVALPFVPGSYVGKGFKALRSFAEAGESANGISAARKLEETALTYFNGARYESKVIKQYNNAKDVYHAFPEVVDNYAIKFGKWSVKRGANGKLYEWLELAGSYNGKKGVFEYIKDVSGSINHRYFRAY